MTQKRQKRTGSIRLAITRGTVLFTLLLSVTFGVACFFLFQNYARASVLRAAEFNLQLVTNLVRHDMVELNSIARLCSMDQDVTGYLKAAAPAKRTALDAYNAIRARVNSCRAYSYLERLVATDGAGRIVQAGSSHISDVPLTGYNLYRLPYIYSAEERVWNDVIEDPFISSEQYKDCLLVVHPIYAAQTRARVGTVYLTASARLITDRLQTYDISDGSLLYFSSPQGTWRIEDGRFVPDAPSYTLLSEDTSTARSGDTRIGTVRNGGGAQYVYVTLPIGTAGLYLTHCIPKNQLFTGQGFLWGMLAAMAAIVMLLGAVLSRYLGHVIMVPIGRLSSRAEKIAGGDFSYDPSIEFGNELGDVGRGINKLSRDVDSLMQRRLADEQERQQLEYRMLQNQISPHFIYNTLNSIKWMASIQGAAGIAEMTTAFAHLLKSVSKNNRSLITLREEFALLNDYCTIQQYRYGGAITIEIADISDETLCNGLIPSFTLQPLAENAIFHGIEPKGGAGSVWLHIRQDEKGDVHILMQDDGVGMTADAIAAVFAGDDTAKDKGEYSRIGLWNVHRRIQYAFGERYGLSIRSEPGRYTCVEIVIPFVTEPPGQDAGQIPRRATPALRGGDLT